MPNRNFIWFMVLSLLILVGWTIMQNQIWPRKEKKAQPDRTALKVNWERVGPIAKTANLVAVRALTAGGMFDPIRLGQDLQFTPMEKPRQSRWEDMSDVQRKIAVLLPPPLPSTIGVLAQLIPKESLEPAAQTITFGTDKTYLRGAFTTRGAGVQMLTLTEFEAANWLGEPTKSKLELIPDDPQDASYLFYHVPAASVKDFDRPPVLTMGRQIWTLDTNKTFEDGTQEVHFFADVPEEAFKNLRVHKTYRLGPRDYHLALLVEIEDRRPRNAGDKNVLPFRYQLSGAHGLPIEGIWYTPTYRDSVIGMVDSSGNVFRTKEEALRISVKKGGEAVPDPNQGPGNEFVQYAGVITQFFGAVVVVDNDQPSEAQGGVDMKKILRWARPTAETIEIKGVLRDFDDKHAFVTDASGWERRYVLLPRVKKKIEDAKLRKDMHVVISYYELGTNRVATEIRQGESPRGFLEDLTVRVNSEIIDFTPGKKVAHKFLLYHGPVKTRLLGQLGGDKAVDPDLVDRYTDKLNLRTLTDYRSAGPFGAFSQTIHFTELLIAVTSLMHNLLYFLHLLVGNYGLSIILLTVIVRGLMFPISRKQAYFSVKMQEIAPEMKKIKEKYPNDRTAQSAASMELYRKHNVHPLGSCLPLLLQMPIFLGLYYALQESMQFRLAEFLWIKNLAAPDMLLWWTENIPWVSEPDNLGGMLYLGPFLNLLPIIAVSFMIVQQKMMTPPAIDEQQEMQQKMMKYMMVFMGIMFYKVASGLCLYFISTSLWGLAERRLLPKKKPPTVGLEPLVVPGKPPPGGAKNKNKGKNKKEVPSDGMMQKLKDRWEQILKDARKK